MTVNIALQPANELFNLVALFRTQVTIRLNQPLDALGHQYRGGDARRDHCGWLQEQTLCYRLECRECWDSLAAQELRDGFLRHLRPLRQFSHAQVMLETHLFQVRSDSRGKITFLTGHFSAPYNSDLLAVYNTKMETDTTDQILQIM
jgi:hypothetical protein